MFKKKPYLLCFCLILGYISLTNCGDSSTNNTNDSSVIIPLAVGNSWQYATYRFRSSNSDSIYNIDTVVNNIIREIILNNEKWFIGGHEEFALTNRKDGLWMIEEIGDGVFPVESASLFFKYPTTVGDEWHWPSIKDTIRTAGINELIVVPGGTFKCIDYQVKYSTPNNYRSLLFAPNVGQIYDRLIAYVSTEKIPPDTVWRVFELIDYSVHN